MKKTRSHVHVRTYFGEQDAESVIEWLNSPRRPEGDPVGHLVELNSQLPIQTTEGQVSRYLGSVVARSKLAVAPVLVSAAQDKWTVDWKLVGRMDPQQALALVKILHLADRGLIVRVRKCGMPGCEKWFYARFDHQRFHSEECQQGVFRSDPSWRRKRAAYMRELRQSKKLREQRWMRAGRKGKGR